MYIDIYCGFVQPTYVFFSFSTKMLHVYQWFSPGQSLWKWHWGRTLSTVVTGMDLRETREFFGTWLLHNRFQDLEYSPNTQRCNGKPVISKIQIMFQTNVYPLLWPISDFKETITLLFWDRLNQQLVQQYDLSHWLLERDLLSRVRNVGVLASQSPRFICTTAQAHFWFIVSIHPNIDYLSSRIRPIFWKCTKNDKLQSNSSKRSCWNCRVPCPMKTTNQTKKTRECKRSCWKLRVMFDSTFCNINFVWYVPVSVVIKCILLIKCPHDCWLYSVAFLDENYLLALSREWMGCWGLPGLLLIVSQWIIPENSLLVHIIKFHGFVRYPLVNVYITMENHHFLWENPL